MMAISSPVQGSGRSEELECPKDLPGLEGLEHLLDHKHPSERISGEVFGMLWLAGLQEVVALVAAKQLGTEDLLTLLSLASLMQLPSGKIQITSTELASLMKRQPGRTRGALSRLRREGLVAMWADPRNKRRRGYLINPRLLSVGGATRRGYTIRLFEADRVQPAGGKTVATPTAADSVRLTAGDSIGAQEVPRAPSGLKPPG